MDTKEEEKKTASKLQTKSREFKPTKPSVAPAEAPATSAQPVVDPNAPVAANGSEVAQQQVYAENQFNDPNQQYLQYVNYYLNQGLSTQDAEAWAKYYIEQQSLPNPEQPQAYYDDQYQADGSYPEEYPPADQYPAEQYEQPTEDDGDDFEVEEFGDKTKKPQGERKKEKYRGQHNAEYDENEEGYYDELGFYYNPDGSFYDPDGYYFDTEGYDKFGGYYDDSANYISADGKDPYTRDFKGKQKHYESHAEEEEGEGDEKYNEEYIQYITNSKYYDDLEFLKSTRNEWAYLKVGNLAEGTIKTDLLKFFGNQHMETSQITIMMHNGHKHPVANLEIYKIPVAIQVLKECGNELNGKRLIIEVDNLNEKLYNGTPDNFNKYEYEDEHDARYTKFDPEIEPEEEVVAAADLEEEAKEK